MPGPPVWENAMDDRSELKDIKKSYGKKEVLRGVSMPLEKGRAIALAGPNGEKALECRFAGSRQEIRNQAVQAALHLLTLE